MMIPLLDRDENIVGDGGNAGYQNFLTFPQIFKCSLSKLVEIWDCVVKG